MRIHDQRIFRTFLLYAAALLIVPGLPCDGAVDGASATAAMTGAPAPQPPARPPADIAAQNEALRQRVRDLAAENRKLHQDLLAAYAKIEDLQRALGIGSEQTEAERDPVILPEDQPHASPDAAFAAIQFEYFDAIGDQTWDTERARMVYLRTIRSWMSRAEKDHHQRIDWVCEISDREQLRNGESFATVVIRDPETWERRCNPVTIRIPRHLVAKLDRIDPDDPVRVTGIFRALLTLNEERTEPGTFDIPRLVGPFVEYDWKLQVQSVSAAHRPDSGAEDRDGPR